ncbi:hypothetical protein BDV28DRAFT_111485 [Aspergillus coremiiformis]|uniref:Uncharacterized protein n=1 Tax=Aspergillus coremiiformis TaxID=138285 RepID=A0A5N6Z6E5_9EURO|nr:hypothetical protein BDV28DRAFT_111485 [Aspergillus coremiiformis]
MDGQRIRTQGFHHKIVFVNPFIRSTRLPNWALFTPVGGYFGHTGFSLPFFVFLFKTRTFSLGRGNSDECYSRHSMDCPHSSKQQRYRRLIIVDDSLKENEHDFSSSGRKNSTRQQKHLTKLAPRILVQNTKRNPFFK